MTQKNTHPWLRGMEVDALHPLRAGEKLPLLNRNNNQQLCQWVFKHLQFGVSRRQHIDVYASECLSAYLDIQSHVVCGGRLCAASGVRPVRRERKPGHEPLKQPSLGVKRA